MSITYFYRRIRTNFSDPDMRAKVLALVGGKAIGLILLLTAMRIYLRAGAVSRRRRPPARRRKSTRSTRRGC